MENPFKFGSLVDAPYFTDRVKELDYIVQFLKSENHLVLMSPRRFGKSSLVKKAVVQTQRPYLWLNMQAVLSKEDFAAKLLKELLNQFKLEKMKHYLRNFRIIPSINMNPMTDELSVSFQPSTDNGTTAIEDVLDRQICNGQYLRGQQSCARQEPAYQHDDQCLIAFKQERLYHPK